MLSPAAAATRNAIAETDRVNRRPSSSSPELAMMVLVQNSISASLQAVAGAIDQRRQRQNHQKERKRGAGVERQRLHLLLTDDADLIHDIRHRDDGDKRRGLEQTDILAH